MALFWSFAFFLVLPVAAYASEGSAFPQLDPHVYSSQIFWILIHFIAAYFLIGKVAMKRLAYVVEKRRYAAREARALVEDAEVRVREAQKLYQDQINKANSQAFDYIKKAQSQLEQDMFELEHELEKEIAEKLREGDMKANQMRHAAFKNLTKAGQQTAHALVSQLPHITVTDDFLKVVDLSLKENANA